MLFRQFGYRAMRLSLGGLARAGSMIIKLHGESAIGFLNGHEWDGLGANHTTRRYCERQCCHANVVGAVTGMNVGIAESEESGVELSAYRSERLLDHSLTSGSFVFCQSTQSSAV